MANDCLVTKFNGVVNNNSLPYYNGLKLRMIKGGDGTGRTNLRPFQSNGSYKDVIQYKVLDNNGTLYSQAGVEQGKEYNVQGLAGVTVPGDPSTVLIKNFDQMTDVIGIEGTSFTSTPTGNNPVVVIDTKELSYKPFLKQINFFSSGNWSGYIDGDDIADLSGLTELTYLNALVYTSNRMGGDLSSLHNLKSLKTFIICSYIKKLKVKYGLDDIIAMTALTDCEIEGGTFKGGDVYELLSSKEHVNFYFDRTTKCIEGPTCSYVSGTSAIPTFTFKKLSLFGNSIRNVSVPTAKAILMLFKDGINANKITVQTSARIELGLTGSSDTELTNLASDVEALGITVILDS